VKASALPTAAPPSTAPPPATWIQSPIVPAPTACYAGNKRRAAAALGISRGYLYKRLSGSSEAS